MKRNIIPITIAIVITSFAITFFYRMKLKEDFGLNKIAQLNTQITKTQGEANILSGDINVLKQELKEKEGMYSGKVAIINQLSGQKNEIENAIYYLNKSLGRETK